MNIQEINEIIACLHKDKARFYYFKDRYALLLLSYWLGSREGSIQELKKSSLAKLLQRPLVRDLMESRGNGCLRPEHLDVGWPSTPLCFLLSYGIWGEDWQRAYGRWGYQTSRGGANLVLHLNFSSQHDRYYDKFIRPQGSHPFVCRYHPHAEEGKLTLCWARLDIDMERGEALIEEIQNDWIRLVTKHQVTVERLTLDDEGQLNQVQQRYAAGNQWNYRGLSDYLKFALQPYLKLWDEAMLAACIWFLREEIGIRKIFYHEYRTGSRLKLIDGRRPPKSLYTTLPKRFCFQMTEEIPEFLIERPDSQMRKALRVGGLKFWALNL